MTDAPKLTEFNLSAVADVPTEVLQAADWPAHCTPFGDGQMTMGHLAGPEGDGGVALWTAESAGFETGPKPQAEAAFILEGVLRLTPTGGEPVDITTGNGYFLPIGWEGRIEAIEPVRKVYIVL